ncbi:hypothetical protein BH11PSE14_BH11PSE14_22530 [soil metagenome]
MAIEQEAIPTASASEVFEVSLDDAAEAGVWAMMLGCSIEALRKAVAAVGPEPERIREFLRSA